MVPLSTVLAGVLVFRERLKPGQWAAVGLAVAATSVLTAAYGRPPWIALALCLLMAVYAVLKKLAAAPVLEGFTLECLAVLPLAVGFICWLAATGEVTVSQVSAGHTALAVCSGVMTTVPLLLHAASITSLPLFVVGVVQYLNPTVQFVLAVTVIGEQMTSARWWGFALVWVALAIFTASSLPHRRSPAATSPPPQSTVPRIVSPDPSKRS